MGFWTKEKRDEHLTLLKREKIQEKQILVNMCVHNNLSLKNVQSFFMSKPYHGDELRTIFLFGFKEDTALENQAVFDKYGGKSQSFRKHCKVRFATWLDAELALGSLKRDGLTMGFSFEYSKLKKKHLKFVEQLKLKKKANSGYFIKTDVIAEPDGGTDHMGDDGIDNSSALVKTNVNTEPDGRTDHRTNDAPDNSREFIQTDVNTELDDGTDNSSAFVKTNVITAPDGRTDKRVNLLYDNESIYLYNLPNHVRKKELKALSSVIKEIKPGKSFMIKDLFTENTKNNLK